ncbi:MAG TPA: FGGY family carbohydrate kinase [Solirubrobacteraceae bacterium]|nr:FGGY family carbohydrate kinase [Solirubrobacteraceae bacterium]
MSGELLLGLDLGTTSCKAAVVTPEGDELAHGRAQVAWELVATGAEIAPQGLLDAALAAAREALAAGPGGRVAGLGVASMAETGVLLDGAGAPVVSSIAWHDSRGEDEAARLAVDLGRRRFSERTGLEPRPLCTVAKYRWMLDHREGASRGVRWLGVAEWVVHGLGGDQVAELSLASRTGWLDLHARDWWDEALAWAGAPAGLLPEPAPAGTPAGTVADALPEARGAVLAVGGHDHLSAAVGAGAIGEGDVLDSWGTAEAFVRAVTPLPPERVGAAVADGINVGWHAVAGRQCLLGAMRSGAALQRVLRLLGVAAEGRAELERAALEVAADAGGMELRGLNDDRVELVGIGQDPSPALVWRAALESAGRGARDILDRMDRVAGPRRRLVVAGGWAEGEAARAVKEAHLGPFEQSRAVYMGARGAALTAGRAAGIVAGG